MSLKCVLHVSHYSLNLFILTKTARLVLGGGRWWALKGPELRKKTFIGVLIKTSFIYSKIAFLRCFKRSRTKKKKTPCKIIISHLGENKKDRNERTKKCFPLLFPMNALLFNKVFCFVFGIFLIHSQQLAGKTLMEHNF